jgi:DeoR/GlpR family transcriptional regulator of sugar metabolism
VDLQRAEAVRAMAESAKQRIILTDSTKFNNRGVVSLMPAQDVAVVITDSVPDNCRDSLLENGVEIVIA